MANFAGPVELSLCELPLPLGAMFGSLPHLHQRCLAGGRGMTCPAKTLHVIPMSRTHRRFERPTGCQLSGVSIRSSRCRFTGRQVASCATGRHHVEGAVGAPYEVTGGPRQFLRRVLRRCWSGAASQKAEEQPSRSDSGKNADHISLFPAHMVKGLE
jgi:hypothetical protein